ncbi:GNAT family N-acetyltransferase [Spelaeicoccus albus]|uniref:Ribosomal protein S18 acetylase RimI-like enzyme n=1 Tax=Spelaeicoccus albus TaxID=1280376 RepID=A0A7Z0IJC9_9MICO|nr:GNAT family N-acetyltransferase [Spelaeicoccus albus]NYI69291.1 ribosomal protein S18 acetylase RimI-like enzyme [Spelaeicoccus albus]
MADGDISIVPLDEVDGQDLRDFLISAQSEFWDGKDLSEQHQPVWFRQFAHDGLIARRGSETVGYLLGSVPANGHAYIHLVATKSSARGSGIGRSLYGEFASKAEAEGATSIQATTVPDNASSIAFHSAMGYRAELVSDYAGPGQDRVLFELSLDSTD